VLIATHYPRLSPLIRVRTRTILRVIRNLLIALGMTIATAWVGLFGARAVNPDSGAHSEVLRRVRH
jgi:hypothetical protein